MGLYSRYMLPWLIDRAMRQKVFGPYRAGVTGAAQGRVLEFGIGSGLNLPLYGAAVHTVIGVEPSSGLLDRARRQPRECRSSSSKGAPKSCHSPTGASIRWSQLGLCARFPTRLAPSPRRIVSCGRAGALLFVEHGKAPEPGVARWQDRLDPVRSRLAGGCHLNRPIDRLIQSAGFRLDRLETSRVPGPRTHTFLYHGRAVI